MKIRKDAIGWKFAVGQRVEYYNKGSGEWQVLRVLERQVVDNGYGSHAVRQYACGYVGNDSSGPRCYENELRASGVEGVEACRFQAQKCRELAGLLSEENRPWKNTLEHWAEQLDAAGGEVE